jgi:subtilisin family serine protease
MAVITINGNSFDPLAQHAELMAFGLDSADSSKSNYILLQTGEPMTKAQKEQLKQLGVEIIEYVPDDAYIAYYPPADLSPVRGLSFIKWAGIYPRQVKVEPVLRPRPPGAVVPRVVNAFTALPELDGSPLAQDLRTVEVVLHGNVDAEAVREKIASAAGLDPEAMPMHSGKVRLKLSADRIARVAQIDEVRHIEEYSGVKPCNNVARGLMDVDAVQVVAGGLNFAGAGEVVAICDTGLDKGDLNDMHPAFKGRVAKLSAFHLPKAIDKKGHGTHVAGSVLGDDVLQDGTPIRGTAPRATLVMQSVSTPIGDFTPPDDLSDLFTPPYQDDGARVHLNAWSSLLGTDHGMYSEQSREVDKFVWEHRDLVICFAVGNDGSDDSQNGRVTSGSISPPSTAKNCISVGASESRRPELANITYFSVSHDRFPVPPIASDPISDNPDGVVAFSSRGPTRDHRIKPDLVAPGCSILSAKSRDIIIPVNGFGKSSEPNYMFDAGSSMATALVAGCAAVVRESFRVRRGINPSAALVKAMLINGATLLTGQYIPPELGPIPNENEGFGRVSLAASLAPEEGDDKATFCDEGTALDVGDEEGHTFTIPEGAAGLKVTLVWTDPPGEALQNDLDLIVRDASGAERHGNMPPNSTDFDRVNNVEQVIWTSPAPGDAQIIVRAFRIPVNEQSYALIVRAY